MPAPIVALVGAWLVLSCRGEVIVEAAPCDGGAARSIDGATAADVGVVALVDVVVPDVHVDANGAACTDDDDCEAAQTCQMGVCCAGEFHEGVCFCGGGPGCDLFHVCCTTVESPAVPVCAANASQCCGATAGAVCGP